MPAELRMEHVATRQELQALHTIHALMLAKAAGVVFRRVAETASKTDLSNTMCFPSVKLADLLVNCAPLRAACAVGRCVVQICLRFLCCIRIRQKL
jgi:hypothetical protein